MGYDKSKGANNMISQKSGMVSTQNPMSQTTSAYQNNYDSRRTAPSIANTTKVNNDPSRSHYMRTGETSANNPFESNKQFYSNHKGKKVDEFNPQPTIAAPKFQTYTLKRILDKCIARGERGLFGLNRIFKTFDSNGNGLIEPKEFKRALKDYQLGLEDGDIDSLFKAFDNNGDGVLSLKEFTDMLLGQLNDKRLQVIEQAWTKLDKYRQGSVSLDSVKDGFQAHRHPDVSVGKKSPDEAITDFLEIYDIHHNVFNNYNKTPNVSKAEFTEYYRTLGAAFDEDNHFISLVKNCWDLKEEKVDSSQRNFAGGNDDSKNARERFMKQNVKNQPFGTSQQEDPRNWTSSNRSGYG